jgi:hypothetical protein
VVSRLVAARPRESCYRDGAGDGALIMERKLVCDDRLDVARRLYRALCAQYPDRFITLFDADGACVAARSGRPEAPAVEASIHAAPIYH